MTRFLALLALTTLLLPACIPQSGSLTLPPTAVTATPSPSTPELTATTPTSCFDNVTWFLAIVDPNGDSADPTTNNDYLADMTFTFSDLTQYTAQWGAAMIDYNGQPIAFMTNAMSNQDVYVTGSVTLYNEDVVVAELVPTINDPWVTWDCP